MGEIWKPIPEFPGYEASSQGNIRSFYKRIGNSGTCARGVSWEISETPQRILAGGRKPSGHLYQHIKHASGEFQAHCTYALVALAFLGPCPSGLQIYHVDRNRLNNCIENLRYDTHANIMKEAALAGTMSKKLTNADVLTIRTRYAEGECSATLANEFGVTRGTIQQICRGSSHVHIGGPITKNRRRLSNAQARTMRELRESGFLLTELGTMFGVDESYVSLIVRGLRCKNAGGPLMKTQKGTR